METLARWLYPGTEEVPTLDWIWGAGDWAMYPILLIGLLAIPLSLFTLIFFATSRYSSAGTVLPVLLLGLGVLAVGVGQWAGYSAERQVEEAIQNVNPMDVEIILEAGRQEAQVPRRFGLLVGLPIMLLGGVLTFLRFQHSGAPAPEPGTA